MRVNNIRIVNFRSLVNLEFSINDYSVILGKNNEGKSNVLRAIKRFYDLIDFFVDRENKYTKSSKLKCNIFDRVIDPNDIPVSLQKLSKTSKKTEISLTFSLDEDEQEKLNSNINSGPQTTGYLEIGFSYTRDMVLDVYVKLKKDIKSVRSVKKVFEILKFIKEKFQIVYIEAIRTEDKATGIIEDLISERLSELSKVEKYQEALHTIEAEQNKVLQDIANEILPDLSKYISDIKRININSRGRLNRVISRNFEIMIDDGRNTNLSDKGDGIKSLVVLSLLSNSQDNCNLVLIDEPEAHLHSKAIIELKNKIKEESSSYQILISTHHQIFVDRSNLNNNLILSKGKIQRNPDMRKIREELGVSISENLLNSELVLMVEGETDKQILVSYISNNYPLLSKFIREDKFVIDSLQGVKNLQSKLSFYKSALCNSYVILDNDKIVNNTLKGIDLSNIYKTPKYGREETEFENLLEINFIYSIVDEFFGVKESIRRSSMNGTNKFTDQLRSILDTFGKEMTPELEQQFKWEVVTKVQQSLSNDYETQELRDFLNPILDQIQSHFNIE